MKHIISPGFAKSGTTLMHHMLNRSPQFVAPRGGKELNVFHSDPAQDYKDYFDIDPSRHVATIEFSPTYFAAATLTARRAILQRIKNTAPEATIVVAIRNPIERAISHYVHLLQDFARFGRQRYSAAQRNMYDVYALGFASAVAVESSVGLNMAEALQDVLSIFGKDRLVLFFLETDGRDMSAFLGRLSAAVDAKIEIPNSERVPKVGAGRAIPQHFYSEEGRSEIMVEDRTFRLPTDRLYIASDSGNIVLKGLDPQIGRAWHMASSLWTSEYSRELLDRMQDWHFGSMAAALDDVIAETHDADRAPKYAQLQPKERTLARSAFTTEFLEKIVAEG